MQDESPLNTGAHEFKAVTENEAEEEEAGEEEAEDEPKEQAPVKIDLDAEGDF